METELARTFLTVVAAGNFVSAAERLHVTQSTVSARIHTLEEQLGCSLFVRNKAGTRLTAAGRQFQKHAAILVRTVERARQDVGIAAGYQGTLTVGGRFGLWEGLLLEWLPLMRKMAPDISVRAEIGFEEDLMQGLVEGRINIGVMYTPQSRPGLTVERLLEERLVLVSTKENGERSRTKATSTSTGALSSMPSIAFIFRTMLAQAWSPTSAGSGCSTSCRAVAPVTSRFVSSRHTWRAAGFIAGRLRPSSGCRPTRSTRTSLGPMPWAWRLGRCGRSPPAREPEPRMAVAWNAVLPAACANLAARPGV